MGLNKVMAIGRLGQNPELKYTPSGVPVVNFTIAVNENWKDKAGVKQERTEWLKIVAWEKTAEICAQYLTKGKEVFIEGKLQTRKWQDKDGHDKYTTEVVTDRVQFLGSPGDNKPAASETQQGLQAEPSFTESDIPF